MRLILALLLCVQGYAASVATVTNLTVSLLSVSGANPPAATFTPDNWGTGDNAFSIEFVTIGNPTNAPTTNYVDAIVGRVDYEYRIAKYEISEHQVWGAKNSGNLPISPSSLGTNKPATMMTQWEMAVFVNWLNTAHGFPPAYQHDADGFPVPWGPDDCWTAGGTNVFRHKDCRYFLPSWDELNKAARYDAATETWFDYANGSNTPPIIVEGYFSNGSTNVGTAVFTQRLHSLYPEHDSPGNVVNVTLTTDAGAVTGIAFDSYVSGLVFQETNSVVDEDTIYKIVQGAVTNATAKVATWQTITNVPGTFMNYVGGAGYTDGAATVTLSGDTVNVTLITSGGAVVGAIPTGGKFASLDYTTDIDIVQAGGSNATCRVSRYSNVTYDGPKIPLTWTIVSGGSGYSNGAATFTTHDSSWYPDLDPLTGVSYYTYCVGAADVDRAGGPSPYGVYGLGGNVTDCSETQHDAMVDDIYVNVDPEDGYIKYYGGWWFRNYQVLRHGGNDIWRAWLPSTTRGAQGNGVRIASKVLP